MTFVRTARPQDLEHLVELLRLLFAIEEDFNVNADKQRQGLALVLDDERSRVLVAEVHGKVVGMCTGQLVISTAEGGPAVLVEDVVVDPGHRGQGIGRALLDALATWARNQGASRMQLLADTNNRPALVFYDRRGWQRTALICLRRHLSGI
ncbi:Acetyltransferase, GNAT family [Desulfobulbus propionicus DSM 2032]|uniref:Acetyltransferase, GNAT family n=1 Tax=Desulfobulbus propionicus (strain ATCC 33891 / DSM 2032 / VKM B-1956 / 1pr3) TaxID=577650 RepID=A0A7U4DQJ5_DESPD|nr:GNAT family N-acetyltransferase [Desulfobulbus propionicus]ADW19192.1 Acetyltransferase, GNAT family [Desulfobulbus propionicus DSM 2032]